MDAFGGLDNFWDLSQHPSTFSTLPEDDFLALLQKQFPTNGPFDLTTPDGIDPVNINPLPLNPSPPSTDSSPSPPSTTQEPSRSRRQSGVFSSATPESNEDPSLKRKASDDSMSDEPTYKTAHTGKSHTELCIRFADRRVSRFEQEERGVRRRWSEPAQVDW